jgi:AP-3 complex subunit mu
MIHSLFIYNHTGEILIEKHWRGATNRSVAEFFWEEVNKLDNREDIPPILNTAKYYLFNIHRNNIFFMATATNDVQPLWGIEFLHRVYDIFQEYFTTVDESTLKENFSTVYQVLEEMLDHGYAMTTEPNSLKMMIPPPTMLGKIQSAVGGSNISDVLPDGTISSMPWRKAGVRYTQNEIYFDVEEEINAIVDHTGTMVSCEVNGIIKCNSRLSGVPDLSLIFVDPTVIDDCSFHPCVRYSRYERDSQVSFVPPDGHFELMRYRVNVKKITPPVYCEPRIAYHEDRGTVSIMVGERQMPTLSYGGKVMPQPENISVTVPFPKEVRTADMEVNCGKHLYDQAANTSTWTVGKIKKNVSPSLTGKVQLHPNSALPEDSPPVLLDFQVPNTTVSGLAVETLLITNERYKPYKGVKTMTKAGKFQFRVS